MMKTKAINRATQALLAVGVVGIQAAWAQQDVAFNFGIPVAPEGLADEPLGEGPWNYRTGEDMDIRVTVVTKELEYPFGFTFLPNGDILVATRGGEIRRVSGGLLDPNPVAGAPDSFSVGISGLPGAIHGYMDVILHPEFEDNELVYLSYTKPLPDDRTALAIGRARWNGRALRDFEDIYVGEEGAAGPSRLVFGHASHPISAGRRDVCRRRTRGPLRSGQSGAPRRRPIRCELGRRRAFHLQPFPLKQCFRGSPPPLGGVARAGRQRTN